MKKSSNKGFTLVELIIVIAILAIIMLIAIPNFSGIQQRMQVRADKSTAAQIGKAVRVWFTDYTTDKGMLDAAKATADIAAGKDHNYAPYEVKNAAGTATVYEGLPTMKKITGGANDGKTEVAPVRYDELVTIDEYISRGQEPTSLKPDNVTAANQHYCVFLTAGATDTAAKIGVAVTVAANEPTTNDAIGTSFLVTLDTNNKVVDNYDGTAPGVAYIEP